MQLVSPRARPRRGWRPPASPAGTRALLCGWIDNPQELRVALGVDCVDPAVLYACAVERWGDEADRRVNGTYSAVLVLPDGSIRLSRSPWGGKPLFYSVADEGFLACSITRPLFASGISKRLRQDAIDRLLTLQRLDEEDTPFEGVRQLPQGSVAHVTPAGVRIVRWYDPLAIAPVRPGRDADHVEAANALLADAVRSALACQGRVGMTLSGGLDSAMVCEEILRQLPVGQRLMSFTFHPLAEWEGKVAPHAFGDDRPYVEAFARMHPTLDPVYVDNRGIAFDDRDAQVFAASEAGYPARVLGSVYHGVFEAARDQGCDWVFGADWGNMTFSCTAPWAWPEYLKAGRWGELWRMGRGVAGDARPVALRIASRAVLPLLQPELRERLRRIWRRGEADDLANPFLCPDGRLGAFAREANLASNTADEPSHSRAAWIANAYANAGMGGEVALGTEQVFGIRLRDVTAYRPLIEFCNAIPTDQYVRKGESRYLARRMAVGRMPEAQRTNRLYGGHNVDWHARLTPRREELRRQVEEVASHPDIGPLVDSGRMLRLLDEWPETTPDDPRLAAQYRFFLPAVLYVTKYVDAMTGRNG